MHMALEDATFAVTTNQVGGMDHIRCHMIVVVHQTPRTPKSHEILMFVCRQKDAKQCCDAVVGNNLLIRYQRS